MPQLKIAMFLLEMQNQNKWTFITLPKFKENSQKLAQVMCLLGFSTIPRALTDVCLKQVMKTIWWYHQQVLIVKELRKIILVIWMVVRIFGQMLLCLKSKVIILLYSHLPEEALIKLGLLSPTTSKRCQLHNLWIMKTKALNSRDVGLLLEPEINQQVNKKPTKRVVLLSIHH